MTENGKLMLTWVTTVCTGLIATALLTHCISNQAIFLSFILSRLIRL